MTKIKKIGKGAPLHSGIMRRFIQVSCLHFFSSTIIQHNFVSVYYILFFNVFASRVGRAGARTNSLYIVKTVLLRRGAMTGKLLFHLHFVGTLIIGRGKKIQNFCVDKLKSFSVFIIISFSNMIFLRNPLHVGTCSSFFFSTQTISKRYVFYRYYNIIIFCFMMHKSTINSRMIMERFPN